MYRATGFLSLEGLNNFNVFSSSPGLFDECLSVEASTFQGQYCSAFFQTEILLRENNNSIMESVAPKERVGDENTFKLPRVGFCIPSSCSPSEFRSSVSQLINNYNNSKAMDDTFIVTITDENFCYTKKKIESYPRLDGPSIFIL